MLKNLYLISKEHTQDTKHHNVFEMFAILERFLQNFQEKYKCDL